MSFHARASRAAALLALTAVAACSDGAGSGNGRVSILLTDAPGDVRKAVVTIDRIYLQAGDGDGEDGRIVLREEDVTTDLLTLADSTAELVRDAVVPGGSYNQLRFVITGGYIEVENADGTTSIYASSPDYAGLPAGAQVRGELQMPSYSSSGVKVKLPGDGTFRVDGDQRVLLVDFDVAQSFGHATGGDRWVMRPVLEATSFDLSGGVAVSLVKADSVTLPVINNTAVTLAGWQAVLTNAAGSRETHALTDANNDGTYEAEFRYVIPGAWSIDFVAPSDSIAFTTNPSRPASVVVNAARVTPSAFVLTSARK